MLSRARAVSWKCASRLAGRVRFLDSVVYANVVGRLRPKLSGPWLGIQYSRLPVVIGDTQVRYLTQTLSCGRVHGPLVR
jgi:hypothetical protein